MTIHRNDKPLKPKPPLSKYMKESESTSRYKKAESSTNIEQEKINALAEGYKFIIPVYLRILERFSAFPFGLDVSDDSIIKSMLEKNKIDLDALIYNCINLGLLKKVECCNDFYCESKEVYKIADLGLYFLGKKKDELEQYDSISIKLDILKVLGEGCGTVCHACKDYTSELCNKVCSRGHDVNLKLFKDCIVSIIEDLSKILKDLENK